MKTISPPPRALIDAVENALAPYKAVLSAVAIERMRREALAQLGVHPYPAALLRALAPPPAVQDSDVVRTAAAMAEPAAEDEGAA